MKFSEKWLREIANPPVSRAELVDRLTMSGLEVESVAAVAGEFAGVCVAEIRDLRPHPDAERLRVCAADVGEGRRFQVVTGAGNVRNGMRVPFARVGAALPGGQHIERSKLRGIESEGMLCSPAELAMAESAEGVMELPPDAPLGADLRDYLGLDDFIIELNITPNRGDCLSVLGLARELSAEFACDVNLPKAFPVPAVIDDRFPVEVLAPSDCPRYVGRVIEKLNPQAVTPLWMIERLRRCGLRAIHPIVDVTNYAMLELGQPMHAFDLRKLIGGIRVRRATHGEEIELLDGQMLTLTPDALVIADQDRAVALAGIMGGSATAVSGEGTTSIFLESAFFAPEAIAGRARQYKLQTDSSYRFERGVDFELQVRAVERATALIVSICGGRPGPVIEVANDPHLPKRRGVLLRRERLCRVLGFSPDGRSVEELLKRLGMDVQPGATDDGWSITPPAYRFDVDIESDLIEEVVRIAGYDRVPPRLPAGATRLSRVAEGGISSLERARETLVQRGYQEAITYSFVDSELDHRLRPDAIAIPLANPISQDMAVMRTTLWSGLLRALIYNQSRQQGRIRLFEIGRIFEKVDGKTRQINKLSGIVTGSWCPEQWAHRNRSVDLFDVKGDVEAVLAALAPRKCWSARLGELGSLHPGRQVRLIAGTAPIAILGALHPDLLKNCDAKGPVYVFELDLDAIGPVERPRYVPLSKFPSVRRDLSLTVDTAIPADAVVNCVREDAPEELRDLQLFDVYEGEGVDSGKKSIAMGLTFQGTSSTLIDKDIETMVNGIVARLAARLGGKLRE